MAIHVGVAHPRIAVQQSGSFAFHGFAISQCDISAEMIIDSQAAPPGRYVLELFERTKERAKCCDSLLIFNPLLRHRAEHVEATIGCVEATGRTLDAAIFTDISGCPVAYLMPAKASHLATLLMCLSCTDDEPDSVILSAVVQAEVSRVAVPIRVAHRRLNGFAGGSHLKPVLWCARHAAELLARRRQQGRTDTIGDIPMAAVMPHHAGDVLLLALAAERLNSPFSHLVVCDAYADILPLVPSALKPIVVRGSPPGRNGNTQDDPSFFGTLIDQLPSDYLYVYFRTNRYYQVTDFHLLDHFAFALGRRYRSMSDLLAPQSPTFTSATPRPAPITRKVLLHFDAGWHLKRYPVGYQNRLIEELANVGCELTLFDSGSGRAKCRHESFRGVQALRDLVAEHDLVIGMDSFPATLSAYVVGRPTITLFANTHPVFTVAPDGHHIGLSQKLSCAPCIAEDACPRFGGSECRNFPIPEDVARIANDILSGTSLMFPPPILDFPRPSARAPHYLVPRRHHFVQAPRGLVMNRTVGRFGAALEAITAPFESALELLHEFRLVVRREGLRYAIFLVRTFLAKLIRDTQRKD